MPLLNIFHTFVASLHQPKQLDIMGIPLRITYAKKNVDTFQKINILFTAKYERRVVNLY